MPQRRINTPIPTTPALTNALTVVNNTWSALLPSLGWTSFVIVPTFDGAPLMVTEMVGRYRTVAGMTEIQSVISYYLDGIVNVNSVMFPSPIIAGFTGTMHFPCDGAWNNDPMVLAGDYGFLSNLESYYDAANNVIFMQGLGGTPGVGLECSIQSYMVVPGAIPP